MSKAGRKRKQGKRTPSGRLSRAGMAPLFDKGTEHVQAMQALYGPDGADAIGRAYRAGLLGNLHTKGAEAKAMLDTARKISNLYWRAYETGAYKCTLSDRQSGSVAILDHERIKRQERQLNETLDFVNGMGRDVRRAFDELCIDVNPDHGPVWLDGLLWAKRTKTPPQPSHEAQLQRALDALDILANGG